MDLYAVVSYEDISLWHVLRHTRLNNNLCDAVCSLRRYDSPFIDGFPLPCQLPIQAFLKLTEACALADALLNQHVNPRHTVHGLTHVYDEMIGAVEDEMGGMVKIVMVMHIFATEHSRRKGEDCWSGGSSWSVMLHRFFVSI